MEALRFIHENKMTPTEQDLLNKLWEQELKPEGGKVHSSRLLVLLCGIENVKVPTILKKEQSEDKTKDTYIHIDDLGKACFLSTKDIEGCHRKYMVFS